MSASYFDYWGKARSSCEQGPDFHLLPFHLLDVVAAGSALWDCHPHWRSTLVRLLDLPEPTCRALLLWLLAVHDLGKFSPYFQGLNQEAHKQLQPDRQFVKYRHDKRHDVLGFSYLISFAQDWAFFQARAAHSGLDTSDFGSRMVLLWQASCCHHGKPKDCEGRQICENYFEIRDREAIESWLSSLQTLVPFPELPQDPLLFENLEPASFAVAGFVQLADWLGSNQSWFPYQDRPEPLELYLKRTGQAAERAVALAGLRPTSSAQSQGFSRLWPELAAPSPSQELLDGLPLGEGPQLYLLEDLTGGGKTEAALSLAQRLIASGQASGFYFALPTMATADQIFARSKAALPRFYQRPATLVLAHGARQLSGEFRELLSSAPSERELENEETPASVLCTAWLGESTKKGLLADCGVGTIDQALLAVIHSNHQSLRLLGLIGKVLILDEVHAYDDYTGKLLETLLHFHAHHGGSAILLSATLSLELRQKLLKSFGKGIGKDKLPTLDELGFPLLVRLDRSGLKHWQPQPRIERPEGQKAQAQPHATREREIWIEQVQDPYAWIREKCAEGAPLCWIRNSVDDAREAYSALCAEFGSERVQLFHARFPMERRLAIQNHLLERFGKNALAERRRGQIVVATQVMEQSLDVDFDFILSDLAPIDLLIQRIGRSRRHARDRDGRLLDPGLADQRGRFVFGVHGPAWTTEPAADWHSAFAKRAAMVYQASFRLWLSARELTQRVPLRLPRDTRALIEAVYGSESGELPATLKPSEDRALGKIYADRNNAHGNLLRLDVGYKPDPNRFVEEEQAATRLGEDQWEILLAHWADGELRPFAVDPEFAWDLSGARIPFHWLSGKTAWPKGYEEAKRRQSAERGVPPRWRTILPMEADEAGGWRCASEGNAGKIRYDEQLGLFLL